MGMLDSSLGPNVVSDFVREVSQSGLTHEVGLVGGGLLLFVEFLIESEGERERRRLSRRWWWPMNGNVERDNEDDMVRWN